MFTPRRDFNNSRRVTQLPLFSVGGTATWQIPQLTHLNRLPARTVLVPFPDAASAMRSEPEQSPFYLSLDGKWRFRYLERPSDLEPAMIERVEDLPFIEVPGVWTRQGYGRPHYTNIQMPFPNDPPAVPEDNPVGVYQREFDVPAAWEGRRTIVHFGGAESVLYVFIDGKPVGMSKDSRLPSEFEITSFVQAGRRHLLTAIVVKWSDASFIEDQDQWWMGGLHRSVFLVSMAKVGLWDVFSVSEPAPGGGGDLRVTLEPWFESQAASGHFGGFALHDSEGVALGTPHEARVLVHGDPGDNRCERMRVVLEASYPQIAAWTAETPSLYRLLVWIKSPSGAAEYACIDIGFRKVTIEQGELRLNGRPLRIHGVNRHEHDDVTGKAISRESMERDVRILKENNFNAVRTSHYPNDPYFYRLCDRHGLYVFDEANIECHSHWQTICRDVRYLPAFVDRVSGLVLRDKNHASILVWSLGNESGMGPNHEAAAGWVRGFDPTRPLHYEGGISIWQSGADWYSNPRVTDIVCPMYPSHSDLMAWGENPGRDRRPVILCEYSHAMGNSNGGLGEYFDIFEKYPGFQGGFIWEMFDHGLRATAPDGTVYWKYGGDFEDVPNDANFVCDGLFGPDRLAHPAVHEYRFLARPVAVTLSEVRGDTVILEVENKRCFTNLADVELHWDLLVDGDLLATGTRSFPDIPPGSKERVEISIPAPPPAGVVHLNTNVRLSFDAGLLPAGHVVSAGQLILREEKPLSAAAAHEAPCIPVRPEGDFQLFDCCGFQARIENGQLSGLLVGDQNLLAAPVRLNLFRAATDNDGLKLWTGQAEKALGQWLAAGLDALERHVIAVEASASGVLVEEHWTGRAFSAVHHCHFSATEEGLACESRLTVGEGPEELPRVGLAAVFVPGFEKLRYFGRGPWENYVDRKRSARLAIHQSTVAKEYVPYVMPQEHGQHSDCRWVEIASAGDLKCRVDAGGAEFGFAARHHSDEDLFAARHTIDLPSREETFLYLDHVHAGLGTNSCGPGRLPAHRITGREFAFRFVFKVAAGLSE